MSVQLVPINQTPAPVQYPEGQMSNYAVDPQGMICYPMPQSMQAMQYGMSGLGELTDAQTNKIIMDHFNSLSTEKLAAIALEGISGKFDTVKGEVKQLVREICIAGVKDEAGIWGNKIVKYIFWASVVIAGIVIMKKFVLKK